MQGAHSINYHRYYDPTFSCPHTDRYRDHESPCPGDRSSYQYKVDESPYSYFSGYSTPAGYKRTAEPLYGDALVAVCKETRANLFRLGETLTKVDPCYQFGVQHWHFNKDKKEPDVELPEHMRPKWSAKDTIFGSSTDMRMVDWKRPHSGNVDTNDSGPVNKFCYLCTTLDEHKQHLAKRGMQLKAKGKIRPRIDFIVPLPGAKAKREEIDDKKECLYKVTVKTGNKPNAATTAKFCLALRYFATGGNYSLIGDSQHVSKALVSRAVRDVSDYFYRHQKTYIRWPGSFEERVEKATDFYRHKNQKTPNVIGMVDGTHIPILTPKVNEACYVNRRSYHSLNATVFIKLKGRDGVMKPQQLTKKTSVNFSFGRATKETFYIKTPILGELRSMVIYHDGLEKKHSWYLEEVEVCDVSARQVYLFTCRQWLSIHDGDYSAKREIRAEIMERFQREYLISVTTGNKTLAGTDATVTLTLIGKLGSSSKLKLSRKVKDRETLQKGATDTFNFVADDIGPLQKLRIEHNNSGRSPDWYLEKIEVEESEQSYLFPCGQWIPADDEQDQVKVSLELYPVRRNSRAFEPERRRKVNEKDTSNYIDYSVTVLTGDVRGAGTDANVYLVLMGKRGRSEEVHLNDDKNNFERGMTDQFKIKADDVGNLKKIRIRHDNTSLAAGWFLNKIVIRRFFPKSEIREKLTAEGMEEDEKALRRASVITGQTIKGRDVDNAYKKRNKAYKKDSDDSESEENSDSKDNKRKSKRDKGDKRKDRSSSSRRRKEDSDSDLDLRKKKDKKGKKKKKITYRGIDTWVTDSDSDSDSDDDRKSGKKKKDKKKGKYDTDSSDDSDDKKHKKKNKKKKGKYDSDSSDDSDDKKHKKKNKKKKGKYDTDSSEDSDSDDKRTKKDKKKKDKYDYDDHGKRFRSLSDKKKNKSKYADSDSESDSEDGKSKKKPKKSRKKDSDSDDDKKKSSKSKSRKLRFKSSSSDSSDSDSDSDSEKKRRKKKGSTEEGRRKVGKGSDSEDETTYKGKLFARWREDRTPYCDEYEFLCNRWLATDEDDKQIQRDLKPTSVTTFYRRT